jgi:L-seryl-tRNA(Ser) seleniumtransferase
MSGRSATLRSLPGVDRLLRHARCAALLERYPRHLVTAALRAVLEETRAAVGRGGEQGTHDDATFLLRAEERLEAVAAPRLRRLVNASGVVVHTNLGRAPLAAAAIRAVTEAAAAAINLEFDLGSGKRGERDDHVEEHLCALTGAEAATVVNNNAAAVLLALNTLADGRAVIVSRGELIEIGGSFRIPEILAKSGARLREVGTTNRTHARDYERAIDADTALLLKVHTSNYRVVGFTASVSLEELVRLGRAHRLPVMEDLGSGALIDLAPYGLPREPVVAERVRFGADVVTFSGDKLLGGPQAGIIAGRREVVDRMRQNPLKRAVRCDKLTIAALEATLRLYRTAPDLRAVLPALRFLARPLEEIAATARAAEPLLAAALGPGYRVEVVDGESEAGSGALPAHALPTKALAVSHPNLNALDIAARFRASDPPIIGRVHGDRFLLDLRCIDDANDIVPGCATTKTPRHEG